MRRAQRSCRRVNGWCSALPAVMLSALALGLSACESASAPEPEPTFDAAVVARDYAILAQLLEATHRPALEAVRPQTTGRSFEDAAARAVATAPRPLTSLRLISPRSRGVTFVYDASAGTWRADSSRGGAPSNGARFILYATDADGTPQLDRETGYADLLDEGAGSDDDIALRLRVVEGGITRLDYAARVPDASAPSRITLAGVMRDATDSLTFDLQLRAEPIDDLPTTALDLTLRMPQRDLVLGATVRGANELNDDGEVRTTATHGGTSLDAMLTRVENDVAGHVDVNQRRFVVISGRAESPTLRRPNGDPLGGAELLFVAAVADVSAGLFDVAEGLVRPLDNLLLLASLL